jgi:hypothetical protein
MAAEMHDAPRHIALLPGKQVYAGRRTRWGHGQALLPQTPLDKLGGHVHRMHLVAEPLHGLSQKLRALGVLVARGDDRVYTDEIPEKIDHLVPELSDSPLDLVPLML